MKPGVTGWSQVRGRNDLCWPERLRQDVWYVDHQSLRLDLRILLRTVRVAIRRAGVSHDGHVTMPRFTGAPDAATSPEPAAEADGTPRA